jgi:hypothetical protein
MDRKKEKKKTRKMNKLPMIMAVGAVIDYISKNPGAIPEEVMPHVLNTLGRTGKDEDRRAAIAGANSALKFLRKNPKASKKEVMQHVMDESDILSSQI